MNPIKPTVGRVVYFTPAGSLIISDYTTGVCAALITAVHNENCVNLTVFDANGQHHARCSVCHVSTLPEVPEGGVQKYDYWDWMPYQKGQAAKTEQLEQKYSPQVVISDTAFPVLNPNYIATENGELELKPDISYDPVLTMNFGGAIAELKAGHAVARHGWNNKSMWIALGEGNSALEAEKFWNPHSRAHAVKQGGSAKVEPYIIFKNAQGGIQMGWQPSQDDVLANDWMLIKYEKPDVAEPLSPHNTINS